jgi:Rrf2 family nitric oxide-sensitive transcriptional repressor
MKRKDNNSGFFLFWRGAIMQLKITTDYAIRIVYYLACRGEVITASELAYELKIPESYIPKITKKLKEATLEQLEEVLPKEVAKNLFTVLQNTK